ncbi:DUF2092 domain-containing protein [Microvirga sp. KLBC 81]|uniref:DUF2092 domain-containing protein n=1 Tax=Microvirga sp. KLBC 81 TaxID=1862707 RepID=UPI0014034ED4|nr:DUF2092 domain-containing protein [Microvirga sp. KLBC 81]
MSALGALAGLVAVQSAHAQEPPLPVRPALSEDADAALAALNKTLSAPELSFAARTSRVYLGESGQPLHIFHTMKVLVRRPDRLKIQVTGDDGSNDLVYDGKTVSLFSPDRKVYSVMAAPGGIPAALNEVLNKLNIDFPLVNFFGVSPEQSLLRKVVAGWQVGTATIDGVECRHLFFQQMAGTEMELWVENNHAAIPRRLIVTYRLLPGQPRFVAEFTNWDSQGRFANAEFAFQPPADAKQVELPPAAAPGQQRNQ